MNVVGHGVDLVAIDRIESMLAAHPSRFPERCFTDGERRYAESGRRRRAERYAARFASKEAVLKALGTGLRHGIRWTDIGVEHEPSGRPTLRIDGRCRELAESMGICRWHLSISHAGGSAGYAIASVVAIGHESGSAPHDG